MAKTVIALSIGFIFAAHGFADDKAPKTYPLHGTVIAMRTESSVHGAGVYTDPYGKTRGGGTHTQKQLVYTIRTHDMDYDVESKDLSVNDEVALRVEKHKVFIQSGSKERKCALVGEQSRKLDGAKIADDK